MVDVDSLVDVKNGMQAKRIFWDEEIYRLELEKIFGRCWLFLTHDSIIPNVGDYTVTFMGEDEVLVVRQRDGSVKAFLNYCTHRGARVVNAEAGNARGFTCTYHGWAFALDGSLESVPFEKEVYGDVLKKDTLGMKEVRVESYKGFWYGNFDHGAPSLADYLGDYRWFLDIWMDGTGGAELIGPPARSILKCNWKTPTENFIGDAYHVGWTHAASLKAMGGPLGVLAGNKHLPPEGAGVQITSRHGHGVGILFNAGPALRAGEEGAMAAKWYAENQPKVAKRLSEAQAKYYGSHFNASIFPNNSYLWGTNTFKVWHPRGPHQIEVFTWTIVEKNMPQELKDAVRRSMLRTFGTAGMLESDDSDNMESMTNLNRGPHIVQGVLNSQMGMGNDHEDAESGNIIGPSAIGETSYRGFYRAYREYLKAKNWDEIRVNNGKWKDELLNR